MLSDFSFGRPISPAFREAYVWNLVAAYAQVILERNHCLSHVDLLQPTFLGKKNSLSF